MLLQCRLSLLDCGAERREMIDEVMMSCSLLEIFHVYIVVDEEKVFDHEDVHRLQEVF